MELQARLKMVRTALYVPAINARALEKSRWLDVDMIIVDLEDSVPDVSKAEARQAAISETAAGFGDKLVALRVNSADSPLIEADIAAVNAANIDCVVIPKVESEETVIDLSMRITRPLIAMIESPAGIYAARHIASHPLVAGLIVGANDIAASMGIKPGPQRQGLELSLQSIVLAAAAAGKPAIDAVCNQLDDMSGYEAECAQGRCFGFSGKTLIHPNQVSIANAAFGASETDIADAEALIAAASGGAQRFRGRMIESMHVEEARRTLARAKIVQS